MSKLSGIFKRLRTNRFIKNTFFLYILSFSSIIFGFISIPYQSRILGPEIFGQVACGSVYAIYVQIFIDFGFIITGTEAVVNARNNDYKLSEIFSCVTIGKFLLFLVFLVLHILLLLNCDIFFNNKIMFTGFLLYGFVNSLLPDYIYRGLQDVKKITYRSIFVKLLFLVVLILFLDKRNYYYIVPLGFFLGAIVALVWSFFDIYKKYNIKLKFCERNKINNILCNSFQYFLSRAAATVYGMANVFIINTIYHGSDIVGLYAIADKIISLARFVAAPLADALFPYLLASKDKKSVTKVLMFAMPVFVFGSILLLLFSDDICELIFGQSFRGAGEYIVLLLPVIIIVLPSYLFGFPVLSTLRRGEWANYSVIIGAIFYVISVFVCYECFSLTVKSVCIITCFTEFIIVSIRVRKSFEFGWSLK